MLEDFIYDYAGYISIFLLFFFMLLTIPVFVSMGLAAFIAALLIEDPFLAFKTLVNTAWQGASIFELVALPLFIFTGTIMQRTDAGRDLFEGIIIPPSIPLILYGVITETSIGQLFIGGVIPGMIMMSAFMAYVFLSRPAVRVVHTMPLRQRVNTTFSSLGVVILPLVIIVAIYTGIFTPTEVGALSVLYVAGLGLLQGRLNLAKLKAAALAATATTSMLFMLIVFGQYFAHFLTFEQVPQSIAGAIIDNASGIWAITLIILTYVVLGMFLESAAMLLISIPIFFPVAMELGMDPVAFGIFAAIAMEIAQISPPIGVNLFTIHGISKISLWKLARGAFPFLLIQIAMLYLVYFFPEVVTWLPGQMK